MRRKAQLPGLTHCTVIDRTAPQESSTAIARSMLFNTANA